jgi:hypothetical protein
LLGTSAKTEGVPRVQHEGRGLLRTTGRGEGFGRRAMVRGEGFGRRAMVRGEGLLRTYQSTAHRAPEIVTEN